MKPSPIDRALMFVADNVRGALVIVGAVLLYHGIAEFSRPAANIVAGIALIALGGLPYLRAAVAATRKTR